MSVKLAIIYRLNESSTLKNSPYFGFIHTLSRLLKVLNDKASLGKIFRVVGIISKELYTCLKEKDPVALFLLYL
jgi:hypothetical protein